MNNVTRISAGRMKRFSISVSVPPNHQGQRDDGTQGPPKLRKNRACRRTYGEWSRGSALPTVRSRESAIAPVYKEHALYDSVYFSCAGSLLVANGVSNH